MKADLDRLKLADPTTYEKIAKGIPLQPRGQYLALDNGQITACQYHEAYFPFGDLLPEVALAWLQAVLQEAIAAQGLYQTIEVRSIEPYRWRALIQRTDGRTFNYEYTEATPAAALLAAYLAACEAT